MAENRNEDPLNTQSLQQDAIRRAREMQARARFPTAYMPTSAVRHEEPHPHTEEMPVYNSRAPARPRQEARPEPQNEPRSDPRREAESEPELEPEREREPEHEPEEGAAPEKFAGGALDFLLKDSEKTLILVLMLILLEEKTDSSLIFALMYLVL